MKKKEIISEKEWLEKHVQDIQKINNMVDVLEKDKRINRIYNKFFKLKNKKEKISYNPDENLSKKFENGILLSSYSRMKKMPEKEINSSNIKYDCGPMIFG